MALISLNNLERFFNNLKTYISNALSSKANASHTHTTADISNLAENWNVTGTNLDISFAGSSNNNGQLSIQINGTDITTFMANQITNSVFNLNFNSFGYNLIPATDNSIDIGSSTKNIKMLYTKGITIDGTQFSPSDYVLPTGSYIQFAGSQAPDGFLVCNGGAISRTTYSQLFAVIGTTYGSGDGSTTFNLPNLTDRFLQGSETSGTVKNAGLPNIRGTAAGMIDLYINKNTKDGAFSGSVYVKKTSAEDGGGNVDWDLTLDFNASKSNSIYGNSTTVQPPALTCLICIKY